MARPPKKPASTVVPRPKGPPEVWLCLSGGNALGAYHAGVYEALDHAGIAPARIGGASIGAVIGAIIVGSPPESRIDNIRAFWQLAAEKVSIANVLPHSANSKIMAALGTVFHGRPGLFHPTGQWWRKMLGVPSPALFELSPMRRVLEQMLDFGRLNSGEIRLIVNAVDVETGEDLIFDTAEQVLDVDHIVASASFPVLYPPHPLKGRFLVDGGLSANLPLRALFRAPPPKVTCLAFDLISPIGRRPESLDDAINRAQDLALSRQSRHEIEWLGHRVETGAFGQDHAVRLLHAVYEGGGEVGAKMLDYSATSMSARYAAGRADGDAAIAWLGRTTPEMNGFTVEALPRPRDRAGLAA